MLPGSALTHQSDQILLRLSSVSFSNLGNGAKAKLSVKRHLKLRDPDSAPDRLRPSSSSSVPGPSDGQEQQQKQQQDPPSVSHLKECLAFQSGEINRHSDEISRLDTWGYKIVEAFDGTFSRIEGEMKRLQDEMSSLRRELDGHIDDFSSLKTNVSDLKVESKQASAERESIKKSLGSLRSNLPSKTAIGKLDELVKQLKSAEKAIGTLQQSSLDRAAEANDLRRELALTKSELRSARDDVSLLQGERGGELRKAQDNINSLREEIKGLRKETTGAKSRGNELKKAQDDIRTVQREIESLREETTGVEDQQGKELKKAQDDVYALRKELRALQGEQSEYKKLVKDSTATSKEYAREATGLRLEMKQLRQDIEQTRASQLNPGGGSAFSSKELDILTNNITMISKKANQVDPLEMEVQLLKSRVQRVEAAAKQELQLQAQAGSGGRISSSTAASLDEDDLALVGGIGSGIAGGDSVQPSSLPSSRPGARKKRTVTNRDAIPDSTSPNKRRVMPTDFSSDTIEVRTPLDWPESSPSKKADTSTDRSGANGAGISTRATKSSRRGRPRKSVEIT